MSEPAGKQAAMETALAPFFEPELGSLRPQLMDDWKERFADPLLADAIVANSRLAPRITRSICESIGQPVAYEGLSDEDRPVVAAILTYGSARLAELAGCLWHRPNVMEWITWNSFDANLPDVDFDILRHCFRKIPASVAHEQGAPADATPDLTRAQLVETGNACLMSWMGSVSGDLSSRLSLFVTPLEAEADETTGAGIIPPLAICLTGGAT